jgi:hypothetical protein
MAGELIRETWQVGLETTYGSTVPATRKVYLDSPDLKRERAPRPHRFMTGNRGNVLDQTLGPAVVSGAVKMPLSSDECLEWWLCGLKGSVSPTHPGTTAYLWTLIPSATLNSMTIERNDGARLWQARGVMVSDWTIAGNVNAEATFSANLFGAELEPLGALTTGLSERTPTFIEGWETRLYIDSFGGTPGTTNIAATLINYNVSVKNNLGRKYFADNTQALGAIAVGPLDITATLLFEASAGQSLTEYLNWDGLTKRLVRLELGQNSVLDAGTNEVQSLAITGTPTSGTFTLTYSGQTTAAVPYNATATQVQTALRALSNIGYSDVSCTGGPLPGTPVVITFAGALASTNVAQITTTDTLGGGSAPASAVTTTTPGVAGYKRFITVDLPGAWSAVNLGQSDAETRCYELSYQFVYDPTNAFELQVRAQNSRATAW